uniref:PAN domain protein n=1 Tax=Marseillevirus LCMAC101 TaxID=2506602 RepID=A0A481YT76_9VIRU|nr:MAG: PAN domain protein [Marseillevirus LCMAC101]
MSVYEILPFTNMPNPVGGDIDLEKYKRTSLHVCKRFCKDTPDCVAFTWNPDSKGTCTLKNGMGNTNYEEGYQLYIKKGNSNYILFWIIMAICLIALFMFMCKQ